MRFFSFVAALSIASTISAQNVTNCVSGGVCYAVNIPEATASSGSGDIFIHISGPTSLSWIGVGQGSQMRGSNIFMIYANAAGNNVTVSPRIGLGESQPLNSGSTAQITLLEGSGIENSVMTANFKCSNCDTWSGGSMSFTDSASSWIWSYQRGQSISSDSLSASLTQHSTYGGMTLNLQSAAGGSSVNPFLAASQSPTSNTGTNTNTDTNTNTGSDGANSADSTSSEGVTLPSNYNTILMAHGIIGPIAFVILYPLGAISIRLLKVSGIVWLHAGWMIFTYMLVLASMGLGIWIAKTTEQLSSSHAIIGLVVVAALFLQPITGLLHHRLYKSRGGPNTATYPHVWWGRLAITLGIINGGLGLRLAKNTRNGEIAYGVVAGVMWVLWMAVVAFGLVRGRGEAGRVRSNGSSEKTNLQQDREVRLSD